MLTSEQFPRHLRDALNHLYNPDRLRSSPLASCFGVAGRFDAPSALQRILIDAIESLRPSPGESSQSPAWKIYNLLFYRYVQQFSQQEVADQVGVSVRQLRREQRTAVEALAYHLWEQYCLQQKLCPDVAVETVPPQAAVIGLTVNDELAWLKDALPDRPVDLGDTLSAVLDLARPLADRYGVHLESTVADALPGMAVHPVALRQILLNLITMAILQVAPAPSPGREAPPRQAAISACLLRWEVCIQVRGRNPSTTDVRPRSEPAPLLGAVSVERRHRGTRSDAHTVEGDAAIQASQDMTRRMVDLCGGRLALSADEKGFVATLMLPALEQLPVLVVDDNADTLQLLKRYASGTRYRLIGTRDPEQALSLAEKFSIQVIVLDVMMPQVDGWEVLGRLRQHPLTERIPIVVCTILAQEELALSLGASAFVRKPVTRQAFLSALDRQVARMEPVPR